MSALADLTDRTFGRLTVVKRGPSRSGGGARWACRCSCGVEKLVSSSSLIRGGTKSCGCLKRETARLPIIHGMHEAPEYQAWKDMRGRCSRARHPDWKYYGGRGISVCERWRDSFPNFFADMGPRPEGHSIDRIDNDGNYEPGNCRWATREEQNRNRGRR